ncbi:hypothetical protein B7494_g5521 [Chlorociboria aeruginascens]|nr:hypothetical protein B7494_g5521 [Chlorociboria aeruginascens]
MGLRIVQVCGLWFWVAFTFFAFVVFHQSRGLFPPSDQKVQPTNAPRTEGLTTRQRMVRSETAWRSSVSLRHKMAYEHPQHPEIPFFPAQELEKFGNFGVNDESTFENEMLARIPSAQIFAFDFSVNSFGPQLSPSYQARAHFKKVGLGAEDEFQSSPPFFTLQTLMEQNGHTYIDILKIDIEGSEYDALDSFMDSCEPSGVLPIGQVQIELHLVDDEHVDFERFTNWWERLEGFGMRPTWLEVNLVAVTMGVGKTDPRCVEYVWVNAHDEKSILLQE